MLNFIIRRLMASAVALVLLSILTFLMLRVTPGTPCLDWMTREQCAALKEELGWNKPYFPVSFSASGEDFAWLAAYAGIVAVAFVAWRMRRRVPGA